MKKSYVKPIMESEAFVANEYVANCWYVKCTVPFCNHDKDTPYKKIGGNFETYQECIENTIIANNPNDSWLHKGNTDHPAFGFVNVYEDENFYYHEGGTYNKVGHKLSFEVINDPNHPNAS